MDGVSVQLILCFTYKEWSQRLTCSWTLLLTKGDRGPGRWGVCWGLTPTDQEVVDPGCDSKASPGSFPERQMGTSGSPSGTPGQQGRERWGPVQAGRPPSICLHWRRNCGAERLSQEPGLQGGGFPSHEAGWASSTPGLHRSGLACIGWPGVTSEC